MLTLIEAFERVALTTPRYAALDQAAHILTIIYRDDMAALPAFPTSLHEATAIGFRIKRMDHEAIRKLVMMVIRDLQAWGLAILDERGLSGDDLHHDARQTFAPGHALIIKEAWDGLAHPSVWVAFSRQIGHVS